MRLEQIRSYLKEDTRYTRDEMPQISKKHLKKANIPYTRKTVMVNQLIPVQKERVEGLVDKAMQEMLAKKKKKPLVVSKDLEIVNGHHRYDAAKKLGLTELDIFLVDRTLDELVKEFSYLNKENHESRILTTEEFQHYSRHTNEELLSEAVLELNEQVDYIWENYFEDVYEKIVGDAKNLGEMIYREHYAKFPSTELPSSPEIDFANEVNPVTIVVNNPMNGSYYNWKHKVVSINFNESAIKIIDQIFGTYSEALERLDYEDSVKLENDLSPHRIKGSIHHELSHWVRDSLHNRYLKNLTTRVVRLGDEGKKKKAKRSLHTGEEIIGLSSYEIDAQIHTILQIKRQYAGVWDTMSFEEMIELNPSLMSIKRKAEELGIYGRWKRKLLTRMNREGLLGRSMQ